jgi:hypothetical protein
MAGIAIAATMTAQNSHNVLFMDEFYQVGDCSVNTAVLNPRFLLGSKSPKNIFRCKTADRK